MMSKEKNYPNKNDFEVKRVNPKTGKAESYHELPLADPADSNQDKYFRENADATVDTEEEIPAVFEHTIEEQKK